MALSGGIFIKGSSIQIKIVLLALAVACILTVCACSPKITPSTSATYTPSVPPPTSFTYTKLPSSVDIDAIRNCFVGTGVSDISFVEVNNTQNAVLDYLDVVSLNEGDTISLEAYLNNSRIEPNPPFIEFAARDNSDKKVKYWADVIGIPSDYQGKNLVMNFTGTVVGSSFPKLQIKVDKINSVTDVTPIIDKFKDKWQQTGSKLGQIIGASYIPDFYHFLYSEKTHELIIQIPMSLPEESAYITSFSIHVLYFVNLGGNITRILIPYSQPEQMIPDLPGRLLEAKEMALLLGGQIEAPQALTNTILADLEAIRSKYGENIPLVRSVKYYEPWSHSMVLFLDESALVSYENGNYHEWDALNRQYDATVSRFLSRIDQSIINRFVVEFNEKYHPRLVAEAYFKLTGVQGISNSGLSGDHPNIYPRQTGDQMTYLFRDAWGDCPSGCIGAHYWYFVCSNKHQPTLIGEYNPTVNQVKPDWWAEATKNIEEFQNQLNIPELRKP
jgi:hypothetical protein